MKKSKYLIIIVVIILIINLLILIYLLRNKNNKETEEIRSSTSLSNRNEDVRTLKIENISKFLELEITAEQQSYIIEYTNDFITKFLPEIYNDYQNNKVLDVSYFNKNKNRIYTYSKVYKYEDFENIVNVIKKSKINFNEFRSIEFVEVNLNENYIVFETKVYYDRDLFINLKMYFSDNQVTKIVME